MTRHPHRGSNRGAPRVSYRRRADRSFTAEPTYAIVSAPGHDRIGLGNVEHTRHLGSGALTQTMVGTLMNGIGGEVALRSHRAIGRELLETIQPGEPPLELALKQVAARAFGSQLPDADFCEAIETLDTDFMASDVSDYLNYVYEYAYAEASAESRHKFVTTSMNKLSGFRVEATFVRMARHVGADIQKGDKWQDQHGIDFIVNGVPYDIKSSLEMARKHATRHGHDHNRAHTVKFIPPITAEDFRGHLVVPATAIDEIVARTDFLAMIDRAGLEHQKFLEG